VKGKHAMANTAVITREVTQPATQANVPHLKIMPTPEVTPETSIVAGYGACYHRMVCGCASYKGMNSQPCQFCGHGFGEHY